MTDMKFTLKGKAMNRKCRGGAPIWVQKPQFFVYFDDTDVIIKTSSLLRAVEYFQYDCSITMEAEPVISSRDNPDRKRITTTEIKQFTVMNNGDRWEVGTSEHVYYITRVNVV